MHFRRFYIGRRWGDPKAPYDFDAIGPLTERPCTTIPPGCERKVCRVVAAAQSAFQPSLAGPVATPIARPETVLGLCMARAWRVACQLLSGMVTINRDMQGKDAPFGGVQQSGQGREGSVWGPEVDPKVKVISGGAF